ncbi:hypothetical protein ACQUQU_07315 [Thalassolituus sp. LLYu03]|uniref:hypothetical protein n=1 Tax=Thalassolituus sp. LLYu03 TaxID=3421656 RepID=UPI003D2B4FAA
MKPFTILLSGLSLGLFLSPQAFSAQVQEIYAPQVKTAELTEKEAVDVRHGTWGIGLVHQSQENLSARMGLNLNIHWFAGEQWYVLGEYQYAPFNSEELSSGSTVLLEANETATVLAGGVGYAFMQGAGSFNGRKSFPWQVALEGLIGRQDTGSTTGRYTGLGLSWQVQTNSFWVATGWRLYASDDSRLKAIDVNSGAQWGVSFGSSF